MNNQTLRVRLNGLMLLTGIALTACAIFVAVFFPWREDLLATRWMEDRARSLATTLDQTMGEALDSGDSAKVRDALAGLQNVTDATYAQLRMNDGTPLAGWQVAAADGFLAHRELSEGVTLTDSQMHFVHEIKASAGQPAASSWGSRWMRCTMIAHAAGC